MECLNRGEVNSRAPRPLATSSFINDFDPVLSLVFGALLSGESDASVSPAPSFTGVAMLSDILVTSRRLFIIYNSRYVAVACQSIE